MPFLIHLIGAFGASSRSSERDWATSRSASAGSEKCQKLFYKTRLI